MNGLWWIVGLLLITAIALGIVAGFKIGWKIPSSFDEAKKAGPWALIAFLSGGIAIAIFVAATSNDIRNQKSAKNQKKKAEEREKYIADQARLAARADEKEANSIKDFEESKKTNDEANKHHDAALTHDEHAESASTKAEDALARANKIREERERRS